MMKSLEEVIIDASVEYAGGKFPPPSDREAKHIADAVRRWLGQPSKGRPPREHYYGVTGEPNDPEGYIWMFCLPVSGNADIIAVFTFHDGEQWGLKGHGPLYLNILEAINYERRAKNLPQIPAHMVRYAAIDDTLFVDPVACTVYRAEPSGSATGSQVS